MPAATQHNISFQHVSKYFGAVTALNSICLDIAANQTTAIVGPSGCGKSTLLQLINALQTPDSGAIHIDGELLANQDLQQMRRRMGYCVQHIGLFPHLTIRNNIILLARLQRWTLNKIDQRLDELLMLTALDANLLTRYPHQLSGGQQQRAGLCRALMLGPDFLLLDEPFAAVDPITRVDIHEQYQQLQQVDRRTTLLVTHDIKEALTLADSIVVMRAGNIIAHHSQAQLAEMDDAEMALLNQIRHGNT